MAERAIATHFPLAPDHGQCRLCCSTAGQREYWPEIYLGGGQSLRRCAQCAGVYLAPDFTTEGLARFYRECYRALFPGETPWRGEQRFFAWRGDREIAARRLAFIAPHLATGARLFEMGSGFGAFLGAAFAARPDLRLSASELDVANRDRLLDGAPVNFIATPDAAEAGSVDAVVAFHVLEHLPEPRAFLEWLNHALAPGGRAWIEVPDLLCDWRSRNFVHPAHLTYFSAATLARIATAAGLEVESCGAHPAGGPFAGTLLAVLRRPLCDNAPAPLAAAPAAEIAAVDARIDSMPWRWRDRARRFGKRLALRLFGPGPLGEWQRWRNHRHLRDALRATAAGEGTGIRGGADGIQ